MRVLYLHDAKFTKMSEELENIFATCQGLADAGCQVTLAAARGSRSHRHLRGLYLPQLKSSSPFYVQNLWSSKGPFIPAFCGIWPFSFQGQLLIWRLRPCWVLCTDPHLALFYLRRKIPGTRYLFQINELPYYSPQAQLLSGPSSNTSTEQLELDSSKRVPRAFIPPASRGKTLNFCEIVKRADLLVSSTEQIACALTDSPYLAPRAPRVISPGSPHFPLPPTGRAPDATTHLLCLHDLNDEESLAKLMQVLQLFVGSRELHVHIAGGKPEKTLSWRRYFDVRQLRDLATFHGPCSPAQLIKLATRADAFLDLFAAKGAALLKARPQLAHFSRWGRPIIAPDLPVVREQLAGGPATMFLYAPDDLQSLGVQLKRVQDTTLRFLTASAMQEALSAAPHRFSLLQNSLQLKALLSQP